MSSRTAVLILAIVTLIALGASSVAQNASGKPETSASGVKTIPLAVAPIRSVLDPYPTFDGLAVDAVNGRVVFSDENRHSLLIYDRTAGSDSKDPTTPLRQIVGPRTLMGFVAGVALDPVRREAYTVNNDGGDRLMVFSYDAEGDARPLRTLWVPHQAWGLSFSAARDELAVSVQENNGIVIYRRGAQGLEPPVRALRGLNTGMADPHGVLFDDSNSEILVSNHGNWANYRAYTNYDRLNLNEPLLPGRFDPPSITVYPAMAGGNIEPRRTIKGAGTGLNWPMGIAVDREHNEIAVANYGDNSVLVFRRTASGDARPVRQIRGPHTRIVGPVGVDIDPKNGEIWVANYGDHTAVVFARTANGDAAPLRIVRNAPAGSATCGFTNASAVAYDSKRDEILVPN